MAYKVLTHDYRPPIREGEPLWDGGVLPVDLPPVMLDTSKRACASGWYSADTPEDALAVAGLWPDGWPACVLEVERVGAVHVPPGGKPRSEGLRLVRRCEPEAVRAAIGRWTAGWAGELAEEMTAEQWAWYEALGRPGRDAVAVEAGLRQALQTRGLDWQLRRYDSARAAWDARPAWAAWDGAARPAVAAGAAWACARAARAAGAAWACAWNAGAAWDALSVYYAARKGWVSHPCDLLTVGLRDAYRAGLAVAVPAGPDTLGWVMEEKE